MTGRLEPVHIGGVEGGDGRLLFHGDSLAAVLVRLSEIQGQAEGRWFVEAAFGNFCRLSERIFNDLDEALEAFASV